MEPRLISRGKNVHSVPAVAPSVASMEPRLISRGKCPDHDGGDSEQSGFNGAAADQPRKAADAAGAATV